MNYVLMQIAPIEAIESFFGPRGREAPSRPATPTHRDATHPEKTV